MLYILSGPSCVGKSFTVSYFTQNYGVRTSVPFTTREPRASESEGVHYHFRSEGELATFTRDFNNGYWAKPFGDHWYGYDRREIDRLAESAGIGIIQAYSDIAFAIKRAHPKSHLVFLDYETDAAMRARISERFSNGEKFSRERILHAEHEKHAGLHFDSSIRSDDIFTIVDRLESLIDTLEGDWQQGSQQAGPLSDMKLMHMLRDKGNALNISGGPSDIVERKISGWTIDLTLSSRFYIPKRTVWPHSFRRAFDLRKGSAASIQNYFQEKVVDPQDGVRILAGEFVLASSNEKLTLPDDIVGLLSGRSSYSRLGLSIEASQNFLHPGHNDVIPFQIKNNLPVDILIYPNARVAQVALMKLSGIASKPYGKDGSGKYLSSNMDIRSRYYEDEVYTSLGKRPPQRDLVELFVDLFTVTTGLVTVVLCAVTIMNPDASKHNTLVALSAASTVVMCTLLLFKQSRRRHLRGP